MRARILVLVAIIALLVAGGLLAGCGGGGTQSTWQKLDSGKPAFYYFGAPS